MSGTNFGILTSFDHASQSWKSYKGRIQQYFLANDLDGTTDATGKKRKAILLSALSEGTFKLAEDLALPKTLDSVPFEDIIAFLDAHFTPTRVGFGERHIFYSASQQAGESHTQWAARLRGLTAHCEFGNVEEALRDRFLIGMLPGREKEKLYAQDLKGLTLAKAVQLAETIRCASAGAAASSSQSGADQLLKISKTPKKNDGVAKVPCTVCGYNNHKPAECRFTNYVCQKCNVKGHLRRMCTKVKYVNMDLEDEGDDDEILFKELPPPYRENEDVPGDPQEIYDPNPIPPCEVVDLLANCKVTPDSDVEYAEIQDFQEFQDMGVWHSTPLAHRHKSKISLTWVLKENAENTKPQNDVRYQRQFEDSLKNTKLRETRVVGRNEYYHNLRFRSACEEFVSQDTLSDETSTEEYVRRKHKHRHRRKKRQERFGYDIRDLDSFLSEASIDRPGNIPVVIAYPTTLYQTQKELQRELTLPLGTVVNAVFKNKQWLYTQTPHGDEGYVMYNACLPLGILPNRTPQKKTPCWESSTDIYPRPCGNLTDNEKEQLRTRTRSETRYKTRKTRCAEKDFDSLYLRTKSVCSNIDNIEKSKSTIDKRITKRQTLLVVNSDYKGSVLNKTLSVREGDVVVLVEGAGETDVDADWFYVRKRDGSQGFIPAVIAGHGYI